ncbi:transcription factor 7-like isoform X1 [Thunnus thynnus]|uniref:transcription factor 7-like isoform X1 n=1 Tax=Thunnus thynnus TaxID=8237 RepID=UPI003526C9D3
MEIMPDALDTILSIQNWEYQDSSLETLMLELFPDIFIPSNSDENQTVPTPQPVVKQQTETQQPPLPRTPPPLPLSPPPSTPSPPPLPLSPPPPTPSPPPPPLSPLPPTPSPLPLPLSPLPPTPSPPPPLPIPSPPPTPLLPAEHDIPSQTEPEVGLSMSAPGGAYSQTCELPGEPVMPYQLMPANGLTGAAAYNINPAPQVPLCQDFVQPTQLHTNAGAYVQGQYLANQQPVYNVPRIAASTLPAAPPQMYNVPANQFPGVFPQNLRPVGYVNGEIVYELPNYLNPHIINVPVVTKHEKEDKSYVKKPPNAFMLYRREQRFNVVTQYNITDSAMINKILGEKWKSLSKEEQSKYYNEAEIEKQQHLLQHPEWSAKDNYGKKRKRNTAFNEVQVEGKKRKRNTAFNEVQVAVSAEEPAADSQQAREPYVLSTCQNIATAVAPRCYMTQPYMTQSNRMQSVPQTGMTQSYMTQSNRMQSIPQTGMTQSYMAQLIPQTGTAQSYMTQCIPQTGTTQSYMNQCIPQTGTTQSYMNQCIPQTGTAQSYMTQCIPQTGTAQSYMTQCIPQTGTTQSYMNQSIPQIDMTQLQWCSSPTRPTTVDLVQYF